MSNKSSQLELISKIKASRQELVLDTWEKYLM